jgi:EAL domain-containing protein (putative c-di-GMP-specific phosphodiesterase class I)
VILLEELDPHSNAAPTYAREVGLKVLDQLRIPYQIRGQVLACSASIGVVMWSGHPDEDVTSLLKRSDMAMYGAKREGKDAVRFYDPTMQQATEMRVQLEANLRRALAVGQFLAYFQRRVGFDGSVVGAEVLLRWQHPNDGLVPPASFIPVAEETGLIVPIGKWVLEQACRQLFAWGKSEHTRELFLSVNVSAIEFKQDAFVDEVVSIVRINNVNPVLLELEITESMLFENVNTFIAKMTELRNFGIRFSLDDFGTGYSSLSYLKKLPLNALKIDKSFVNDIETEPNDETIIQTIIKMGQTLGLEVVAEGVETSAQFELLKYHGCRTYQGYLFGKPLPIGDFEAALLNDAATFVPT